MVVYIIPLNNVKTTTVLVLSQLLVVLILFYNKKIIMELYIKDRLLLPTILPEKGSFMEFNLKKAILKKIAITKQERKDYEIVENAEEKRIEWNMAKDMEAPLLLDFSKDELSYLKKACEAISENQLPDEVWTLAERLYNEA